MLRGCWFLQPVTEELLPPEKMVVRPTGEAIDFRVELKRLLNSIMANYGQFMEMLVRYICSFNTVQLVVLCVVMYTFGYIICIN